MLIPLVMSKFFVVLLCSFFLLRPFCEAATVFINFCIGK